MEVYQSFRVHELLQSSEVDQFFLHAAAREDPLNECAQFFEFDQVFQSRAEIQNRECWVFRIYNRLAFRVRFFQQYRDEIVASAQLLNMTSLHY